MKDNENLRRWVLLATAALLYSTHACCSWWPFNVDQVQEYKTVVYVAMRLQCLGQDLHSTGPSSLLLVLQLLRLPNSACYLLLALLQMKQHLY